MQYRPYDDLTSDMPLRESTITDALKAFDPIRGSSTFGAEAKGAYWCIIIGTVLAVVSLVTYVTIYYLAV